MQNLNITKKTDKNLSSENQSPKITPNKHQRNEEINSKIIDNEC